MPTVSQSLLDQVLRETFGLEQFRSKQREVIDNVMRGDHTLAVLPTGYGKSVCYQVPSQVLDGVTLVISPLIALMQDQVAGMARRGIKNVTLLNSSIDMSERDDRMFGIETGEYKLIYVAPERFESARFRNLLSNIKVSLLVIDEAHCISQWGHDFRPQYRNLSSHIAHIPDATILALTATATPTVQADIVRSLKLDQMHVVASSLDRTNLRFEVFGCRNNAEKNAQVERLLSDEQFPAIIYTSSRKDAEAVAEHLRSQGIKAAHYHAGMQREQRAATQRAFETDQIPVITCTVAFGMGIDKSNVRRVIHYSMPPSVENYYQEAGRAGRDGKPATCTLLFQNKDIITQRFLLDRNYPSGDKVTELLELIKARAPRAVWANEILQDIDIQDAALNSALDLLKSLELVVSSESGFTSTEKAEDCDRVPMGKLFERKQRDSDRLQRMINYAQYDRCRRLQIVQYFGQELHQECSGCDVCVPGVQADISSFLESASRTITKTASSRSQSDLNRKSSPTVLPSRNVKATGLGSADVQLSILALVKELEGSLGRTSVAQILSGSKSKKIIEKGLDQNEFYKRYATYGEGQVLVVIDQIIENGEIRVTKGLYPKVCITEAGEHRLKESASGSK